MSTMETRIRHTRTLWYACGLMLAVLLVLACALTSAWQMWHFKSVFQKWHQSSVSVMAQSIDVQVQTLMQQVPAESSPTRVMRYFEQTLAQNPQVLSATLQSPEQKTWVWSSPHASKGASSPTVTVNRDLSFSSGTDWQLKLVLKAADTSETQRIHAMHTLIACALALLVLGCLLRWLWQQQILAPHLHWKALGEQASQGIWESPPPEQNAHALTQASHDAVQRVHLRVQWVRWQQAQWAKHLPSISPRSPT
jgi:hypothetical protein